MAESNVSGDIIEEHGDYRFEIHRNFGQTWCSRTPLGASDDNEEDIDVSELPDEMRQQFSYLL